MLAVLERRTVFDSVDGRCGSLFFVSPNQTSYEGCTEYQQHRARTPASSWGLVPSCLLCTMHCPVLYTTTASSHLLQGWALLEVPEEGPRARAAAGLPGCGMAVRAPPAHQRRSAAAEPGAELKCLPQRVPQHGPDADPSREAPEQRCRAWGAEGLSSEPHWPAGSAGGDWPAPLTAHAHGDFASSSTASVPGHGNSRNHRDRAHLGRRRQGWLRWPRPGQHLRRAGWRARPRAGSAGRALPERCWAAGSPSAWPACAQAVVRLGPTARVCAHAGLPDLVAPVLSVQSLHAGLGPGSGQRGRAQGCGKVLGACKVPGRWDANGRGSC